MLRSSEQSAVELTCTYIFLLYKFYCFFSGCSATTGEATLNDEAMEDDVNQNEEQLEKRTDGIPVTRNNGTDKSS